MTEDKLIDFFSETLNVERDEIEDLYKRTKVRLETDEDIKMSLRKIIKATILIKLSELQSSIQDVSSSLMEIDYDSVTLELALLVSAAESVGTPPDYHTFYSWYRKKHFDGKDSMNIQKNVFDDDWNDYNLNYGAFRSFSKKILEFGFKELKEQFILCLVLQEDRLMEGTRLKIESINVEEIETPEELIFNRIHLHKDSKSYLLEKNDQCYYLVDIENNERKIEINDIEEITGYYVNLIDLKDVYELFKIKKENLDKRLKKKLRIIYDIRSGYYHSGIDRIFNNYIFLKFLRKDGGRKCVITVRIQFLKIFKELLISAIRNYWRNLITLE